MMYPTEFFQSVDAAQTQEEVLRLISRAGFVEDCEGGYEGELEMLDEHEVVLATMLRHALCKINSFIL